MRFDPNYWFVVVNAKAVASTGVRRREILNRVCSASSTQRPCNDWRGQPAVLVDDGKVDWTVTFTDRLAKDGVKKVAFVVEGNWHHKEPVASRSGFVAST